MTDPSSGFAALDRLITVCSGTRTVLRVHLWDHRVEAIASTFIARESLPHVEAIGEGMRYGARIGDASVSEWRDLLRHAGVRPAPAPGSAEALAASVEHAMDLARGLADVAKPLTSAAFAAGHARVIFALIPELEPERVSWPTAHHSYRDVPVPRSAGEMTARIEEMERALWRVATGRFWQGEDLRRTLAFYDAAVALPIARS